ncbi:MAG: hypothetical protein E6J10_06445 [Chloroflexi bacterium]|nr:MAG: hypothetical protein E6J10_06445 [Chloroflexota bacterium]
MSMTQIAAALYQLQQLDLELERVAAEQQVVAKSLQGNARLQELRIEHNRAQEQLRSRLQAQKEAEWALEELTRRLVAQEQRLYSGMVSNPKELNALQQEIQHLRTQQGRQDQLEVRKQELQARRTQMLTSIDAGFISRYEAMRRAKQGRAISKVEQNSCQWCRVILTPSELQRVRISSELQTCSNCGRFLYYDR